MVLSNLVIKKSMAYFLDYTGGIKNRKMHGQVISKNTVINSTKESIKYYQTNLGDGELSTRKGQNGNFLDTFVERKI